MSMPKSTPVNQDSQFGALRGKFLLPSQAPGFYNQTFDDPYLYYHGFDRRPFQTSDGDIRLVAPELPPVNVLNNPRKYNVGANIRDILGGNNRSGFGNDAISAVQALAGTEAPMTPTTATVQAIIQGLRKQNNQGFIKTPPIGLNQYPK